MNMSQMKGQERITATEVSNTEINMLDRGLKIMITEVFIGLSKKVEDLRQETNKQTKKQR